MMNFTKLTNKLGGIGFAFALLTGVLMLSGTSAQAQYRNDDRNDRRRDRYERRDDRRDRRDDRWTATILTIQTNTAEQVMAGIIAMATKKLTDKHIVTLSCKVTAKATTATAIAVTKNSA
jgi:hypothetical protein